MTGHGTDAFELAYNSEWTWTVKNSQQILDDLCQEGWLIHEAFGNEEYRMNPARVKTLWPKKSWET